MNYDLVVIGAGPAGYSAAIRASQLGAKVALIEQNQPGGTCLNTGCVPTKTLWQSMSGPFADASVKKIKTVETLRKGLTALISSYPLELLRGEASFASSESICITSPLTDPRVIHFKSCIIASGAQPTALPGIPFDHHHIIDSTDALNLTELPATMLIIGGGVIGVELATIFAHFGTQVNLCEREAAILPGEDPLMVSEVTKFLARLGVKVQVRYLADPLSYGAYEKVLVAVGRTPNIEGLHLEVAGVATAQRSITVNEYLQTSAPNIFAAGDVTGRWQLAYTAQADGSIAAENAVRGTRHAVNDTAVPRVLFSNPVCAAVGIKQSQATPDTIKVGTYPFTANAMAFIEGARAGWIQIISDASSGTVLGGTIIGKSAEELISVLSIAVRHKLTVTDLKRELFFHPSLSESIQHAAENILGSCVDLPPQKSKTINQEKI
ncbi:MAG: NAD(P)/FAD-dependent oxidoreductase [Elusimicrobia bacterium]|nr:NAD(P)/FAD-dependent oxidoreductase [Elusimicrobiota bacterium]